MKMKSKKVSAKKIKIIVTICSFESPVVDIFGALIVC